MIHQLLHDLIVRGIVSPSEMHGASDGEIASLEAAMGVRLPWSYKVFLRAAGRGAGRFLSSDHWSFAVDALLELNADARPLLDAAELRGPSFCFASRMGDVYLFFQADGANGDPPVYFWNDGIDPRIERGFESFGDWLKSMMDEYESSQ